MMIFLYVLASLLGLTLALTFIEILIFLIQKPVRELPDEKASEYYSGRVNGKSFEELYLFLSGDASAPVFSEDEIYNTLFIQSDYMAHRFDCSDFRAQLLFKIYKDCGDKLNDKCKKLIKNTFLNFKYFMDEPGDDSMCYWSENHQILFAVAEYLAGQEWPDDIFTNSGMTGRQHNQKAAKRISAWMKQRFDYGFCEYLSNNYLAEDISPMANYIAYSENKKSAEQMKIIMDILWLDVALNSTENRFVATSSRMYGNNKAGNFYGNSIQTAMNLLWGKEAVSKRLDDCELSEEEKSKIRVSLGKQPNYIVLCFTDIVKKGLYALPEAIKDIALCEDHFVSKMSCGLSPEDLKNEGLIGREPAQIMAQLGAEAFTNPEVINNTLSFIKECKMYRNAFVGYFRFLDLTILKPVNWSRFAAKFNIMTHGIATGRGNVYTYRTPRYSLSTSVCKNTDACGAQEHIWSANISEGLALFTTHPAGDGNGRYCSSPGYWIGNGRRPMSVQHKNVNITIYRLPTKKRFGETGIANITHAFMPECFYDEFLHFGNMVFARKNNVFIAMLSNGEMKFREFSEDSAAGLYKNQLIPDEFRIVSEFDLCRVGGRYHIYITELSDADKESFDQFQTRIKNNKVCFSEGSAQYFTECGSFSVSYNGEYTLNGIDENKEYARYDSRFCKAERKASEISVDSGKHRLFLCFGNAERREF